MGEKEQNEELKSKKSLPRRSILKSSTVMIAPIKHNTIEEYSEPDVANTVKIEESPVEKSKKTSSGGQTSFEKFFLL